MAPTPSIKLVKTFPYRGGTRSFSNRYHFSGGTPADLSAWTALANAIVADEKIIYPSTVTITEAVAYGAGSDLPLYTISLGTAGTLVTTGMVEVPGDCAAQLRYSTDQRSVKNHPVYLWSWYHAVFRDSSGSADGLASLQKTHIEDVAAAWITGYSDGTNTYHRAGPNGAVALGYLVDANIKHRDFPS